MESFRPEWKPIKTAPTDTERAVWVYQPAVKYAGGVEYPFYIAKAYPEGDGQWYSEEYNVILEPTHWAEFEILPPDSKIIESPVVAPRTFWGNVSSEGG